MTAEKEAEYLFDKNVECPVCDSTFRTRVVKTGRVRRLESDFDLRPRHPDVDTIKYDVVSCPYCGYTALNRFFTDLTRGQKMLIREGVCSKFHPAENGDEEKKITPYSYDKAIDRYKLAFYNALVKKGRASEKQSSVQIWRKKFRHADSRKTRTINRRTKGLLMLLHPKIFRFAAWMSIP